MPFFTHQKFFSFSSFCSSLSFRQSESKRFIIRRRRFTTSWSVSFCEQIYFVCVWSRLFTSYNSHFLRPHKFKQVSRKLHACHDNKTNCYDLWWRKRNEQFHSLPSHDLTIFVWGWLKRQPTRATSTTHSNWHWKNDINFLSRRVEAKSNMRESVNTFIIWIRINCVTFFLNKITLRHFFDTTKKVFLLNF